MKRMFFLVVIACSFLFTPAICQTKGIGNITNNPQVVSGTIRAIIVGISDYKNIQKLTYAHTDAVAFYSYLKSPAGGMVDSNNIILLLNEQATAARIYSALDAMLDVSKEGDMVIFYFSGHGDLETKTLRQNGFLLGYDAPQAAYMSGGTIGVNYLQDYLETLAGKNKAKVVLISDACRSGKLAGGMDGVNQTSAALQQQWQSITKILSSQAGELSYEDKKWGNGGGVFTYYLLRGLQGLADMNNNHQITTQEILVYLSTNVPKDTKFVQNPFILGDLTSVLSVVDSATLVALLNESQTGQGTGELAFKGFEDKITEGLDSAILKQYRNFEYCVKNDFLINQAEDYGSAWDIYELLKNEPKADPIINNMKRTLLAALQDKAQTVINLYLAGIDIPDSLDIDNAYNELEYAYNMIDESYILYNHIKARYLFMKGGVYESDQNERLRIVEEGLELEPDAAFGYFLLASAHCKLENYEAARTSYLKTIDLAPRWAYAWNNLGTIYTAWQKHDSARICYEIAIDYKPDMPEPHYNLGLTCYKLLDYNCAIEWQDKTIAINPEYSNAYNNKGWVYYDQEDYDKALEMFAKASELEYDKPEYINNIGNTYLKLKDLENAMKYFKKALELDPEDVGAIEGMAGTYEEKKDFNSALYYYTQALKKDTSRHYLLTNIGSIYLYELDDYNKGIEFYKEYISFKPLSYIGYLNVGNGYYYQDDFANALIWYTKVIEVDSSYSKGYQYIGQCYFKTGEYQEAIIWHDKALQISPTNQGAYKEKVKVYTKINEYDKAIKVYESGIAADTANFDLIYELAGLYENDLEDYDKAIDLYEQFLIISPESSDAFLEIGNCYYYKEEYEKSIVAYMRSMELNPGFRGVYLDLGNAYMELKDNDRALEFYLKALEVDEKYPLGHMNLGDLYYDMKEFTKAISCYENAIKYDSSYLYLTYTIGSVYSNDLQDYPEAEKWYLAYIDYSPDRYYGYQGLGYLNIRLGKNKKALQFFETAMEKEPNEPWNYYNFGCYYALTGNPEKGLEMLGKAFEKGFDNFEHARTDSDMENVRKLSGFDPLINKYDK